MFLSKALREQNNKESISSRDTPKENVHNRLLSFITLNVCWHAAKLIGPRGKEGPKWSGHAVVKTQYFMLLPSYVIFPVSFFTFFSATSAQKRRPAPHYWSPQSPGTSESHFRHGLLNKRTLFIIHSSLIHNAKIWYRKENMTNTKGAAVCIVKLQQRGLWLHSDTEKEDKEMVW